MINQETTMKVFGYATKKHSGQKRKHSGDPYIVHPIAVAQRVSHLGDVAICAALLHDVVEDTDATYEDIRESFGVQIAEVVRELTDPTLDEGNRARRKEITREKMAGGSRIAKSIKCADILDNAPSIIANDEDFAVVFMREIEALLPFLRGADNELYDEVDLMIIEYEKQKLSEALEGME